MRRNLALKRFTRLLLFLASLISVSVSVPKLLSSLNDCLNSPRKIERSMSSLQFNFSQEILLLIVAQRCLNVRRALVKPKFQSLIRVAESAEVISHHVLPLVNQFCQRLTTLVRRASTSRLRLNFTTCT